MEGQRRTRRSRFDELELEPEAAPVPPAVARLLALQGTAGNAAVSRMVLARQKFSGEKAAVSWLEGKEVDSEDDLEELLKEDEKFGVEKDLAANLVILKRAYKKVAKTKKETAKSASKGTGPARKRTVTDAQWEHISNGELKSDGAPKGWHTVLGPKPVAEKVGDPVDHGNGFYWSAIQSIKGKKKKPDGSSFFPDTWTKQNIIDAIEYANATGKVLETTDKAPVKGIKIWENPDSYFPYFD